MRGKTSPYTRFKALEAMSASELIDELKRLRLAIDQRDKALIEAQKSSALALDCKEEIDLMDKLTEARRIIQKQRLEMETLKARLEELGGYELPPGLGAAGAIGAGEVQ